MRLTEVFQMLRSLENRVAGIYGRLVSKRFRARRAFRRALVVECLEGRRPLAFSIASSGNSITLTGDASDDGVVISVSSSGHFQHNLPLGVNLVSAIDTNGTLAGEQAIVASSISSITITANAGNDTIDASAWTGGGVLIVGGDGDDVLIGGTGNDTLLGGNGNDILRGNAGHDLLAGHAGNDLLQGGEGNDSLDWNNTNDGLGDDILEGDVGNDSIGAYTVSDQFSGGDGTDNVVVQNVNQVVLTNSDYISNGFSTSNHGVENWSLWGTSTADTIDASAWTGGGVLIVGGDGDDVLIGGTGNDTLLGGNGNDILRGNAGHDLLAGHAGNDLLQGGEGNDSLDWNNTNDGLGDDILEGDVGNDSIGAYTVSDQFSGGDGTDNVVVQNVNQVVLTNSDYISNGFSTSNHGVENWSLWGTSTADTIDASAWTGGGVLIVGGDGDDVLIGGTGNDTLLGGNGNDILRGNAGHDLLAGHAGNDLLQGGEGNDSLDWNNTNDGLGDDILEGDVGNDSIGAYTVSDQFSGGDGTDNVVVQNVNQVVLTNSDYISNGFSTSNHGVENWSLWGTSTADTIDASAWTGGGVLIVGGDGDDVLIGGTGNDTLLGGNGNDILRGNAGHDLLAGHAGNDLLQGGEGNDSLDWNNTNDGLGDDILEGDVGNDSIGAYTVSDQFSGGDGTDNVVVQNVNQVVLTNSDYISNGFSTSNHGVENWSLWGTSTADTIDASAWTGGGVLIVGGDGDDVLIGGTGNDTLFGGNGNDDISGGGGLDNLNGQTGNDTIRVPNSAFSQVVGESGLDRFVVNSAGVTVNLVTNSTSYMQGIEEIDISGSGSNSLILSQSRVLSLSPTTDTLIVLGNPDDSLMKDAGWTTTGTETINGALYKVQTNGAATLKVQQATDVRIEREIQQVSYTFDNANSGGFSGAFGLVGVQNYQGLGNTGNTFNASFLKSSDSVSLTLNNLPQHDSVDIDFLLAIIDSWDGAGSSWPNGDYFNVLVDGQTIFRETFHFSNQASQSYQPPSGGLISFGTQLGFGSWSDAAYDMKKEPKLQRIGHTGSTITITWLANGPGWQGGADEFFAIDNLNLTFWSNDISVPSDAAANYLVGQIQTQDIDPSSTFIYSLVAGSGDTDNAAFSISGNEIRTTQALNDATRTSYSIRVRAMDPNDIPFEKTLLIPVANSNAAPVDIQLSTASIAENSPVNTTVGLLTTTDPNPGDTFTYELVTGTGDTNNASFNIVGNALRVSEGFDFESKSVYSVRIRSTDQGGLFTEKSFDVSVIDINEAPTDIILSSTSIPENAGVNARVGTLSTVDPDAGNTFTYTLVAGSGDTDNSLFNISGNSLRANSSFNFEAKSSYSIRLRTADQAGLTKDKVITIQVLDANETPTDISLSSNSIFENLGSNAIVGTLTTSDIDAGDTFTYSLVAGVGGADNSAFNIEGDVLRATNNLDFEVKTAYSIRIRSSDLGGLWTEKAFTINVQDANDISISRSGNSINIQGSVDTDTMIISISPGGYLQHNFPLVGDLVSTLDTDSVTSGEQLLLAQNVSGITIYGREGDDTIDASLLTSIGMYVDAGAGNDIILSGSGNDSLRGGPGNDILKSGAGNDDLSGGIGNDVLEGGAGNDTVDWYSSDQGAGDDILRGGEGNDYLASGPSLQDQFYAGEGTDTAAAGQLTQVTITNTDFISSGLVSANHGVEYWNLYGTNNDDTIDASAWNGTGMTVEGFGGNDLILGSSGNDDLRGGSGDDTIRGGSGNDNLQGGIGNDVLEGGAGNDTVDWYSSDQGAGDDILRGGEGNDYLASGPSLQDQFYAGEGTDTAAAGQLTQVTITNTDFISSGLVSANHGVEYWNLYGTNNDDTIDASAWNGTGMTVEGFGGNDLILGSSGNDDLRGGSGDDTIRGGSGNDNLQGGVGNDVLEGGAGNDTVDWYSSDQGAGDDILRGGEGNDYLASGPSLQDQFYAGEGTDTAAAGQLTQVTITNTDFISSGLVSANHGVEYWNLYGTNNDDTIDASAWNGTGMTVEGFGGNDLILGSSGNDDLRGGSGDDTIRGGSGNDNLQGGVGNDVLEGGAGNDTVDWYSSDQGAGDDILRGGEGNDYLASGPSLQDQFYAGEGTDTAAAGQLTQVTITNTDFISSGLVSANHGVENWNLYGTNNDDTIDASNWTGNGLLFYGYAGSDVLKGGSGSDSIYGGDGNDDITGGGGQDYLNGQSGNDTIRVPNSSFSQVIGDAGLDRFIVNSAGVAINLVGNSTSYMQGIEEIDLTGSGNNSLTLNQSRVLSLSDTTDTLIVSANLGDSVIRDSGWTTTGTETINGALYKVQTNGAATLKIQQATDVRIDREIQQFSYTFENANSDGFSGTFGLVGVQNYQGLGNSGNTFNASFLKSSSSASLTLTNLPDHDAIELDFLLAIIDSWDGAGSGWPNGDHFNVLVDGTTVFRESFHYSNQANQSYVPPAGGLISFGSNLGFNSWADAAYDMSKETRLQRIPHSGSSLTITWQANGPGWEAGDNESWAIDNLKVTLWNSQFAVPDNLVAGEFIGNLTTSDIDPTNAFTYALTSGSGDTDNAYFTIVGNELRTALPLIPSKSSYSIRMRATDNAGIPFDKVLIVQVIPSNKSPSDIALSNTSIAENADPKSLIGSFSTTDPNEGDTFTYSLVSGTGDADNAAFTIDGTSLRAVNSFDFESKSSYSIRVRSTDQGDLWTEKVFTISVTNVNESPTDIALSSTSIAENNLVNAAVGSLSTTDVDASNSFTYSLVPGAGDSDNGAFSIDGSTLRANSSFDFESKSSYSVRIRSTDQGGLFFEENFTINVTDLDENRYFDGLAAADSFIASYTGDGIQAAWTLTRNGVSLFNGSIPNGGALVINALAGADTLQVNGRAVDDLLTFDANRITVNNAPVLFSNTEIVKLLAGLGNDRMVFVTPSASGVSLSYDGGTGTDRVETPTGSNIWNVTGAGIGNVNSKLSFLGAETLVGGSGDDQFILANAGKVTGQILGGTGNDTLNLAAKTTSHTINLQSNTATSTGGIGSIESIIGGSTASVTDVLIGPNVATNWSIDGNNAGSVSNAILGSVAFSGFESLTGGTAADSFVFTNAGNITKTLTGGTATGVIDTLDLSAKTAALDFRLDATASSVPNSVGSYVGFETIIGNSVAGSKVTRVNNTTTAWAVNTLGQIVVNSVTYRNVPGIAGGIGADTLTGPALTGTDVSTWTLDSAGGGTLAIPGMSIVFSGMNNLTGGTGADAFEVLPAGSLSGAINGGTGTGLNSLSYAQWTSNVSVNLAVTTVANATAIAGLTSNIQMVTGGAGNDSLRGQAAKSTVLVGLGGSDTLIGGSQRDLLFGGLGVDSISGVGGDDLIVSGTTSYDTNRTALLAIYAEWISTRTFAVRTANIWGNGTGTRNNGAYFLNSNPADAITDTVFADTDADSLTGGLNQDWFFASVNDLTDFVGTGTAPDRLDS